LRFSFFAADGGAIFFEMEERIQQAEAPEKVRTIGREVGSVKYRKIWKNGGGSFGGRAAGSVSPPPAVQMVIKTKGIQGGQNG
jgi:hypothetical protein